MDRERAPAGAARLRDALVEVRRGSEAPKALATRSVRGSCAMKSRKPTIARQMTTTTGHLRPRNVKRLATWIDDTEGIESGEADPQGRSPQPEVS
jgi:hypothetical protein